MLELNDARCLKYEKICAGIRSPQKYGFLWMAGFIFNENDTTPTIIHKTRLLKKYVTSHKSTNLYISISSDKDNEEIIKNSIRRSKRKYFRGVRSCYSKVSNANSS